MELNDASNGLRLKKESLVKTIFFIPYKIFITGVREFLLGIKPSLDARFGALVSQYRGCSKGQSQKQYKANRE
jgi:hypothetical protein